MNFTFELIPFHIKGSSGRRGSLGEFGDITIKRMPARDGSSEGRAQCVASGPSFPDLRFSSAGPGGPTLKDPILTADGVRCDLAINKSALRNKSRCLTISVADRLYTYSIERMHRGALLARENVQIRVSPGRKVRGAGTTSVGQVAGQVDSLDLALVAIFEEVDKMDLTFSGAALSAPQWIMAKLSKNESIANE